MCQYYKVTLHHLFKLQDLSNDGQEADPPQIVTHLKTAKKESSSL